MKNRAGFSPPDPMETMKLHKTRRRELLFSTVFPFVSLLIGISREKKFLKMASNHVIPFRPSAPTRASELAE